jgi:UDP-GlcNAc:undecaprenyl-phosphate/decaprenyl-phosphate GlcNAc-1-phosphate transferase
MIEMKFILEAALAFLIVFVSTPAVIVACNFLKLHDTPGPLKIHARPIPRLGGVAVTAGLLTGVFVALGVKAEDALEFASCVAALAAVGILDDLFDVSPYIRLALQIAVGIFIGEAGWGIALTNSSVVNVLLGCAVVVFFINAFNFLDGSDGLTAGTTAAIAIAFLVAAGPSSSAISSAIACALLGSSLAFLVFNWPPARVFLGDSGSTVIGLSIAFLALDHIKNLATYSRPAADLFPFVVAAVPLIDAALAIARRLAARKSPLRGDRFHGYDLLLERGFAPRAVAIAMVCATLVSAAVGWIALRLSAAAGMVTIVAYTGLLVSVSIWLGALPLRAPQRADTAAHRSAAT